MERRLSLTNIVAPRRYSRRTSDGVHSIVGYSLFASTFIEGETGLIVFAYKKIGTLEAIYAIEIAFQHNVMVPYLIRNANLSQLANSISHLPGRPDSGYDYPQLNPRVTTAHSQLLESLEFQNLLVARMDR